MCSNDINNDWYKTTVTLKGVLMYEYSERCPGGRELTTLILKPYKYGNFWVFPGIYGGQSIRAESESDELIVETIKE